VSNLDFLINIISNVAMGDYDRKLLNLIFSAKPKQEDLDNFLKEFDIELISGTERILMLAYFKKYHPDLIFPEYSGPRLNGIIEYYKFSNLKTIAGFAKAGKALNDAGIPILLFKGGVMRFLRPDLPRAMGDVDFLVPTEDYERAIDIVAKTGFKEKFKKREPHSVDFHNDNGQTLDLHNHVIKNIKDKYRVPFEKELFHRGTKTKAFGIEVVLPSYEDIVFLLLTNLCNNLRFEEIGPKEMFTLFDCDWILKNKTNFNWDIVLENARKTKTLYQVKMICEFFCSIVPSFITEDIKTKIPLTQELERRYKDLIFEFCIIEPVRREKKQIHWSAVKREGFIEIIKYLFLKLKFLSLKGLRKSFTVVSMMVNNCVLKKMEVA
jgi:hypothetical protein